MQAFRDKVAVITGAASGFGREFARTGASLGMKLVLADIEDAALQATASELRAQGATVLTRRTDVSKGSELQALADATMAEFGAVHLLFNNAGVADGGSVWEGSEADWQWVMGVNVFGVANGLRAFTPLMLAAAAKDPAYEAHIVNTASMAGLVATPLLGIYTASKHAVLGMSEVLHQELAMVGPQVACSVLCPSFVTTGIAASERNRSDARGADSSAQLTSQQFLSQAVAHAQVTAADVARLTFEAIEGKRFFVFPHAETLATAARPRYEAMLNQQAPHALFSANPGLQTAMASALQQRVQAMAQVD